MMHPIYKMVGTVAAAAVLALCVPATASLAQCAGGCSCEDAPTSTATLTNITQINEEGYGGEFPYTNKYSWSIASFKDRLYVGTMNAVGGFASFWLMFFGVPFPTVGVEIWRAPIPDGDGAWRWERVVTEGGPGGITTFGVRKMLVVGDYLYGVTADYTLGFEVWRTSDGVTWEVLVTHGNGDSDNVSGRGLAVYDGALWVGVSNSVTGASLLRREIDTSTGEFEPGSVWATVYKGSDDGSTCATGQTDLTFWFADIVEFDGKMYWGTVEESDTKILRSDGSLDANGCLTDVEEVWSQTFFTKPVGTGGVLKLYEFDGDLYAGTMNLFLGASLVRSSTGDDGTWETVFEKGATTESSGPDAHNQYYWQMQEFNDRLYVGTYNPVEGFALTSTADGETWAQETTNGFNQGSAQYGVRTMEVLSDPERLVIGTAGLTKDRATLLYTAEACPSDDCAPDADAPHIQIRSGSSGSRGTTPTAR